jgi:nuclear transport factor 2 (NTF2) superfamily protein
MTPARLDPERARYWVERWDRQQEYYMAGTVWQYGDDRVVVGIR